MITEAIEKILELGKQEQIEVDGETFVVPGYSRVKDAHIEPIQIHTLNGLLDWLKSDDVEGFELSMIHVYHYRTVYAQSALSERHERQVYAAVKMYDEKSFDFGHPMEIEDFIIMLRSRFVQDDECARTLKFVSSLSSKQMTSAQDNGVSQAVIKQDEIGRDEKVSFDGNVTLRPYRTFPEVEQPASLFYLRLNRRENKLPTVTLHEADGGAWKSQAIENIKYWIRKHQKDIAVIG